MPPRKRNSAAGSYPVTRTGKARPGAACERTVIRAPGSMCPRTSSTPESHRGQESPSTSTDHTASGAAAIVELASKKRMHGLLCIGNQEVTVTQGLPIMGTYRNFCGSPTRQCGRLVVAAASIPFVYIGRCGRNLPEYID